MCLLACLLARACGAQGARLGPLIVAFIKTLRGEKPDSILSYLEQKFLSPVIVVISRLRHAFRGAWQSCLPLQVATAYLTYQLHVLHQSRLPDEKKDATPLQYDLE